MSSYRYNLRFGLETSFLLVVFSLGFMKPAFEVSGISLQITDLFFLITFGFWVLALALRKINFRFEKSFYFLGLYAVGLLFSTIFSENPKLSFVKYLGEVYLIGLTVMTFNLVRSQEMLKKVVIVWIAASTVSALAGTSTVAFFYLNISNFVTEFSLHHFGSLPPGNYPRIQSTFFYPSLLCNYLTVSLMMLLAALNREWLSRVIFFIIGGLLIVTIAFTVTPGIGGVLLAIALWYWLIHKDRGHYALSKIILSAGVLAAVCFILVSTFTLINTPTSPYFYVWGGMRIDPTQRLLAWQGAFHTLLSHPFFGKGLGLGVAEVYYMPPSGQMQILTDAHNISLSVAGQSGLGGILPLIFICIAVFRRTLPLSFSSENKSVLRVGFGIAFVSAFIYQGLIGSFEDARHLWVLFGLILVSNGKLNLAKIEDATSG